MRLQELLDRKVFNEICIGKDTDIEISKPFCCDLLSIAMGKAPAGAVWVTVMANMNTLAVAQLTECACVVFAEDVHPDSSTIEKAKQQDITLLSTELPIYEAAVKAAELMK